MDRELFGNKTTTKHPTDTKEWLTNSHAFFGQKTSTVGNLKHTSPVESGYLKGPRHPPLPESWWGSVCQDMSTHTRTDRREQFCPYSQLQASWSESRMVAKGKHSARANEHWEIKEQHTHHIPNTCEIPKGEDVETSECIYTASGLEQVCSWPARDTSRGRGSLSVSISTDMLWYTCSLRSQPLTIPSALKSAIMSLDENSLLLVVLQRIWEQTWVNKLKLPEKKTLFISPLKTQQVILRLYKKKPMQKRAQNKKRHIRRKKKVT